MNKEYTRIKLSDNIPNFFPYNFKFLFFTPKSVQKFEMFGTIKNKNCGKESLMHTINFVKPLILENGTSKCEALPKTLHIYARKRIGSQDKYSTLALSFW